MASDSESCSARDLTLQKIGRNVVNFQRMEAMLKFVLTVTNFSAPIGEAQRHLDGQLKSLRSAPMGTLVEDAAKALHSEPRAPPENIQEILCIPTERDRSFRRMMTAESDDVDR